MTGAWTFTAGLKVGGWATPQECAIRVGWLPAATVVTHGPVPAREMEKMSSAGCTFTRQAPTASGPGLGAKVTEVDKTPESEDAQIRTLWLWWHRVSAAGMNRQLWGLRGGSMICPGEPERPQSREKKQSPSK